VGPAALDELLHSELTANPALKGEWFGVIMSVFLIGAPTGGVLFGWLGDRIGRVRAMSLSIATYAIFTGLCGFAGAAWHIAVLRFIASLGMGGEWALVTEIWPHRSRAFLAGLVGAAANVGMLLVGLLSLGLVNFIDDVPVIRYSRYVGGAPRLSAERRRLAAADDRRRAAGSAGFLHPSVRARIAEVESGPRPRGDIPLGDSRFARRSG
jgi:MFS family permease